VARGPKGQKRPADATGNAVHAQRKKTRAPDVSSAARSIADPALGDTRP
jgi:hypothetical protein